jgi:glucose/arabinose dehydrogenase
MEADMLSTRVRTFLRWLLLAALAACGGGGGSPGITNPLPSPTLLTLGLRQVASGLDGPVLLTAPAGDRRQFIVERSGRIRILQDGVLLAQPFLDIGARVTTAGEGGLLSMAFDPQYAANGYFFIYYTDAATNDIVIERWRVSADPGLADPASVLEIIRIPHPGFSNHFGGLVSFGPDGYLYLGPGDGGGAGDPADNAQDLGSLLGKLLRLDVAAASPDQPYAIPPTNPFAGQAGRRPEIWAYGLRNPWRYTFDAARLLIADVGEVRREEVDIAGIGQGGLNYGWNLMEGSLCFSAASCTSAGLVLPAFEYDHGENNVNGCAIIGGYVYRGQAIPELAGRYFYSDFCGGYLKSFLPGLGRVTELVDWQVARPDAILSFGRDADGELYLLAAGGNIYRIVRTDAPTP